MQIFLNIYALPLKISANLKPTRKKSKLNMITETFRITRSELIHNQSKNSVHTTRFTPQIGQYLVNMGLLDPMQDFTKDFFVVYINSQFILLLQQIQLTFLKIYNVDWERPLPSVLILFLLHDFGISLSINLYIVN